jgi:hypothetical protein
MSPASFRLTVGEVGAGGALVGEAGTSRSSSSSNGLATESCGDALVLSQRKQTARVVGTSIFVRCQHGHRTQPNLANFVIFFFYYYVMKL